MKHEFGAGFGNNVVALVRKGDAVTFPAVTQVDAYWEGLRDGRLMPDRAEVDPRGLENALEFAFMLELVAPGVARVRVAGIHMSDLLGMEVRGMPLTALFEPQSRDRISDVLDRVVGTPQVGEIQLSSGRGIGRPALTARLLLAPLANGDQGYPRILGCLQSQGQVGRAPRRFTIDSVHLRRIVAVRAATAKPAAQTAGVQAELAEPVTMFKHAPRDAHPVTARTRPQLRLVKSD